MSHMPVAYGWVVGVGWNGNKSFEGKAEQPSSSGVEKLKKPSSRSERRCVPPKSIS